MIGSETVNLSYRSASFTVRAFSLVRPGVNHRATAEGLVVLNSQNVVLYVKRGLKSH